VMLYGGSIMPGRFQGRDVTIQDVFEAVGAHAVGKMSEAELCDLEAHACPGAGACGGQFTANTMSMVLEFMGLSPAGAALGSLPSAAFGVRLGQYGIFIGSTFTASGKPFTPNGTTDFLVAHFVAGGAVWNVSLFVNQSSFVIPDLAIPVPAVTYGTVVNQNQAQFGSDEYRLGDTAADVAAAVTPAVGESWGRIRARYR